MKKRKIGLMFILVSIVLIILASNVYADNIGIYTLDEEYITRILPGTTVTEFKENLETNEAVEVKDTSGNAVGEDGIIGTEMSVQVGEKNYKLSVVGDVTGDGEITITDLVKMKLNSVNLIKFDKGYEKSADINDTGDISITDLVQLQLVQVHINDMSDFVHYIYHIEEEAGGMIEDEIEPDGDEDGDGLTNAQEESLGTNIYLADTDLDGLIDSYEVNTSKTDPLVADTDGDGVNDGNEVELNLNPLSETSLNDGIKDGERELTYTVEDEETGVNIEITGKGNIASTIVDTIQADETEEQKVLNTIYNFYTEGIMNNAKITIKYDVEELEQKGLTEDDITLYYLNGNTNKLEEIESTVNKEAKTINADLSHFSMYVIGRKAIQEFNLEGFFHKMIDIDKDGKFDESIIADNGFDPKENGFSFENAGNEKEPAGQCYGMATFAMAYYINKLPMSGEYNEVWAGPFTKWTANGYDLKNTYFETGKKLYDFKIKDEGLLLAVNEPEDFRDRTENKVYKIKQEYVDIMKKSGLTIFEQKTNKYSTFKAYETALLPSDINISNTKLSNDEKQLIKAIWSLFILQGNDKKTSFSSSPDLAFKELQANLQNGTPVVLGIGNHAINAISLTKDMENPNIYKIAVYDNNYPGEIRYITLTRSIQNKYSFNFTAWANAYAYKCTYNDKEIDLTIHYPQIPEPEQEQEGIYVKLYDDGTLAFTATDKVLEGKRIIKSYGNIYDEKFSFSNLPRWCEDYMSITKVDIVDKIKPKSIAYFFAGLTNMVVINNISNLDTSQVTDMNNMFEGCDNLGNLDLGTFDTQNVTDMSEMFFECRSLTDLNLSSFNTSNVTNMYRMFDNCRNLTDLNLSSFDTRKVTNMSYMFASCNKLKNLNLSSFNTSQVTNMHGMFWSNDSIINLDLSGFYTNNVTDMSQMFYACDNLIELDLSRFNTSQVTNMESMFRECHSLKNLNLSNVNTSKVKNMEAMFYECENLTSLNLSSFNTNQVTNMSWMFCSCNGLTSLDLSSFNTNKVVDMSYMFNGCENLSIIYVGANWTSEYKITDYMFTACGTHEVTQKSSPVSLVNRTSPFIDERKITRAA